MQVPYDDGIASHIGLAPCAGVREDGGEASAGVFGMAKAFAEIMASDDVATLSIAEGIGLLFDREGSYRNDKRLAGFAP